MKFVIKGAGHQCPIVLKGLIENLSVEIRQLGLAKNAFWCYKIFCNEISHERLSYSSKGVQYLRSLVDPVGPEKPKSGSFLHLVSLAFISVDLAASDTKD